MFRYRGNDGNVNLCVASIPQRVKPSAPRGNYSRECKEDEADKCDPKDDEDETSQKSLKLSAWELATNELHETHYLDKPEDA